MQFGLNTQQLEFRDQLRAFLERECTPADVRAAVAEPPGWSRHRWKALADLGVAGLTVPAEHGGLGLGLTDLVALLEVAGRAALPEPLVDTVALVAPLLAAAPDPTGSTGNWLGAIARGDLVAAVGKIDAATSAGAIVGAAGAAGAGTAVTDVAGVDLLLLVGHGPGGQPVVGVAETAALAVAEERAAIDGVRRPTTYRFDALPEFIVTGDGAAALVGALVGRAAVATAAYLVGLADAMLDLSATYATQRQQFGHPIGSFQAVKHHLAGVLVQVEMARPAVYRAALSADGAQPSAARDASMAKALASEAALLATRVALQVHGAIGYTWEHDLHLWMKRTWVVASSWGDAASHRQRVLAALVADD